MRNPNKMRFTESTSLTISQIEVRKKNLATIAPSLRASRKGCFISGVD
jgi:hypothetical protein